MERQQQLATEFVANRHSLYAFIYGFIRNTHDAEDIFQEVWLRFSAALTSGEDIQDQAKWSRGTARHLILHYWRDRKNDKVIVDEELFNLVELAFAEQESNQDYWRARQQALTECVQELPERSQDLLRMKYEQGLSAQDIAEEFVQSVESIWMSLSRLRKALRDCAQRKLKLSGL